MLIGVGALLPLGLSFHATAGEDEGGLLVDVVGDGTGFGRHTSAPWLGMDRLAPGAVETRDIVLWNTSTEPIALSLQTLDLVDVENGCLEPELRVSGEECEDDGGELSSWLTLALERAEVAASRRDRAHVGATLRDLTDPAPVVDATIAPGGRVPFTMRLEFLAEAPNDTMTDLVTFDIRIAAARGGATSGGEGQRSDEDVLAVSGFGMAGEPDEPALLSWAVALPLTDAVVPTWGLLSVLTMVAGGLARVLTRRCHRSPARDVSVPTRIG